MREHLRGERDRPTQATPRPVCVHRCVDASQQAAAQPWVTGEFRQLSAGHYAGSVHTLDVGGIRIVHERQSQTVQKVGATPGHRCTVSLTRTTDPTIRFSQFGNERASWLFFLPERQEYDVQVPGDVETLYVWLDQDRLLRAVHALAPRLWERSPTDLQVFNTPYHNAFYDHLTTLLQTYAAPGGATPAADRLQPPVLDAILLPLVHAREVLTVDTPGLHARRRTHYLVSAAREFIDARLQQGVIPSVVELCARMGVSERTLQYAFRRELQLSPLAYLRAVRLNRVRAALLAAAPGGTVTDIASAEGFLHLGQFARDYRRMFGERPSETLAIAPHA